MGVQFYETGYGRDFFGHQLPSLIKSINRLADVSERLAEKQEMQSEPSAPAKTDARTYMVTEFCPHCENEITMGWNTDLMGYRAFCPVCGKRLMLCDECQHTEDAGGRVCGCDYNSQTDSCRHNCDKCK